MLVFKNDNEKDFEQFVKLFYKKKKKTLYVISSILLP